MKSAAVIICCMGIAVLSGTPAGADIYKYTDENGVIHFTNMPTGSNYKLLLKEKQARANERKYDRIIRKLCRQHRLDHTLVKAVVKAESSFNPYAVSKKGAQGLMQLMPDTARRLKVDDPFDPQDNLQGGIRHLKQLLEKFKGDVTLALAAYNAGETAVLNANSIPPYPETRNYVKQVLQYQKYFKRLQ